MDPLSLAATAFATSRTAYQISLTLCQFINDTNNVNRTVKSLVGEVESLTRLLESISSAVSNPIVNSRKALTPENVELLGSIDAVIVSCRGTVDALAGVLHGVADEARKGNFISRSIRTIRLNARSDDISRFRSEIQMCCTQLQMALQTINLIVSCSSPDRVIDQIVPKIHELTAMVSSMTRDRLLPRRSSQVNHQIATRNLDASGERLRLSAETVLSGAVTVVGNSTEWGGSECHSTSGSVNGEPLTPETSDQICGWIAIEDGFRSFSIKESSQDFLTPLAPASSDDTRGSLDDDHHEESDSENEIDHDLTERLLHKVTQLCGEGKLIEARKTLDQALKIANQLSLRRRKSLKIESTQLELVNAYLEKFLRLCHESKVIEAETLLQTVSEFAQTLQLRKTISLKASELVLAKAFLRADNLEKSEKILTALTRQTAQSQNEALCIVSANYTLAQVYTLKLKFEAAREICKRATKARRRLLGKDHSEYFQSLNLLVCICKAEGDDTTATAYAELLPAGWHEKLDDCDLDDKIENRLRNIAELKRQKEQLDLRLVPAARSLKGHSDSVNAVAFSPDGKMVASASSDKTVRLCDITTGVLQRVLHGHSKSVNSVAFSPDGNVVASASGDKTVKLWKFETGASQRTLREHSNWVNAITFSPDGKLVATASDDKTLRFWDSRTGIARQTLEVHSDRVWDVAFSPDGKLVASASSDKKVRLWDYSSGTAHSTLRGHSECVNAVAFSPDKPLVASASNDKTVMLWNYETGAVRTFSGHSDRVWTVAFSPDGKLVASGSTDKTVRLWNLETGAARILEGHTDKVWAVAFSPDGKLLASGSGDKTVRLWNSGM